MGNVKYVGVVFHAPDNKCYWSGNVGVYAAIKGVIVNAKSTSFGIESGNFTVAECNTNIVLRWGSNRNAINEGKISDSWFSGLARTGCTECYKQTENDK